MSTYNAQLQLNNIDLQEVLQALQDKESGSKIITCVNDVSNGIIEKTITKIQDDRISTIGAYAFYSCYSLATASFPACKNIDRNAFYDCIALTSVSFPMCTDIGTSAFQYCSALATASFPACTYINAYAFSGCYSLTTVSFPACDVIGMHAFNYCYSLTTVSFPTCTTIGIYAFYSNYKLISAFFPVCSNINDYAFEKCYALSSLTLEASRVCTLINSNAFSSTPFAGYSASFSGTPHIYVPASLVDAYKSATNWVYFSSYITAIEDMEV